MYISIQTIKSKYQINLKGILHLGGHLGEEAKDYHEVGCENVIWIEGNPSLIDELKKNVSQYKQNKVFNLLVSDKDDAKVMFNITEFSQSSSILELGITKEVHNTNVVERLQLTANRIDTFFLRNKLDINQYNFLNIDLQGYELIALKSMGELLDKIDWIYTEVNSKELYKGCPLLYELDIFLLKKGFKRTDTYMTDWFWGDALYRRVEVSPAQKIAGTTAILVKEFSNRLFQLPIRTYRFAKRKAKSIIGIFFLTL